MKPASRSLLLGGALVALALGGCQDHACDIGSGEICTIAGTGNREFSGDDGPARDADLNLPQDLTEGPDGLLYVVDWNNHRIRVITDGGDIRTVAGTGNIGDALPGPATRSGFTHPTQVAFDQLGRMLIAAWHSNEIVRVDLATGQLDHVCGSGRRAYSGDDGPAATADFDLPAALVFDATGNLYVMDQANQLIRKIDGDGTITRFAGQCCAPGFAGDGGPATEASLAQPEQASAPPGGRMAFDAAGNLYFADSYNHRIRRIDTSGIITTVAGSGREGYAGDGGSALLAQLAAPVDIEIASDGTIYVADTGNSCVRAFQPGGPIWTVAGVCGQRGFGGDGGPATEALLDRPYGIELDGDDNLYIADTHNHRIRFVPRNPSSR